VGKGAGSLEMKGVRLSAAHAAKVAPGVEQLELILEAGRVGPSVHPGANSEHTTGSS
jgi:hypothetical protein